MDMDFRDEVARRFAELGPPREVPRPVLTPEALVDALSHVTEPTDATSGVALKARAFYRVRNVLVALLGIDPSRITPQTRVAELFPDPERRRAQWSELA